MIEGVEKERSFLMKLAGNLAIDYSRRRGSRERKHTEFFAETGGIFEESQGLDEQEFRKALSEALEELPAEQRAAVHLRLWEGFTFDAIGKALGVSLNTVASRYRYALDKLQERLRPLYEEIK